MNERIVVPAEGVRDFTITGRSTLFRLTATIISGGVIDDPVITGSCKLIRTSAIETVQSGGQPSIGTQTKEFVFRGTAAGVITISIKKTLPTQPMPIVEKYTITVK